MLELPRIDQLHREAARGEELKEGNPVDPGGFHGHGVHATAPQPVRQGVQVGGEGPELPHALPLGIAALGHGRKVGLGPDVDASGVQVDPSELRWQRSPARATVRILTGSRHGLLLCTRDRRAGRGGAICSQSSNRDHVPGRTVTNAIVALLRDHAL
jgi:hypothetical protein